MAATEAKIVLFPIYLILFTAEAPLIFVFALTSFANRAEVIRPAARRFEGFVSGQVASPALSLASVAQS